MSLLPPSQWQWQPAIPEPGYKGWYDAGMTITFNIIQEGKPVITRISQPPLTVAEALGALQCLDSSWTGTLQPAGKPDEFLPPCQDLADGATYDPGSAEAVRWAVVQSPTS